MTKTNRKKICGKVSVAKWEIYDVSAEILDFF